MFSENIHYFFSALGVAITLGSFVYYFYLILKNKVEPHAFTWLIWFVITAVAFTAQVSEGGGAGAWVTGATAINCLLVTALGFFKKNFLYTKFDFACLAFGLFSVPLWYFTKTPIYSVILLCAIDLIAFLPTYRKGWIDPYKDSAFKFFIDDLKFIFGILALQSLTLITILYPLAVIVTNSLFVILLVFRRRMLKNTSIRAK